MATLFGWEIELLCLDLDDTVIDSESGAPQRFEDAATVICQLRPDLSSSILDAAIERALATDPNQGRMAHFLEEFKITSERDVQAVRSAYFEAMPEGTALVDDAHDVLSELLARFQLAIVTNGPSELQRRKLELLDLESRVEWIVISGEVGIEKPDPPIFRHVVELAGVEAGRAAHVGDSRRADVAGANRAGLLSVWVETRFAHQPEDDQIPDEAITHIRELLDASSGEYRPDRT